MQVHQVHKAFRAGFAVIVLGATFVLAMAHVAVSDPAPAYNCGDRGWLTVLFGIPTRTAAPQKPHKSDLLSTEV